MPGEVPWSAAIELRGAGGEPVDLARTLLSHGVADLLPNMIAADGSRLETALTAAGGAWLIELLAGAEGEARLQAPAGAPVPNAAARPALLTQIRHMLRLDEDLSAFYLAAAAEPTLAWVTAGAGRMLRSPTVFEDLVKTICTTNCTWSATVRMVSALVRELGRPAQGAPERHAFPLPEAVAEAGDEFFRDVARAGYRGPYLRTLASQVAEGRLQLEALGDPELADEAVAEQLLGIAGVGPYATAHMMMLGTLPAARARLVDAAEVPAAQRPAARHRQGHPARLRALPPVRRTGLLADAERGLADAGAVAAARALRSSQILTTCAAGARPPPPASGFGPRACRGSSTRARWPSSRP